MLRGAERRRAGERRWGDARTWSSVSEDVPGDTRWGACRGERGEEGRQATDQEGVDRVDTDARSRRGDDAADTRGREVVV
jgi:hypothetical protein